jgi:NAD(P)-dependent dehydrogenase (short-subunit alcohol dehydrogenase family)
MERITTPFGFQSTAAEVAHGIDFAGKRVIVTGGASGIGLETARALAGIDADVTLAVRNADAGVRAASEISVRTGNGKVLVAKLDLSDLASVCAFVGRWDGPLHVLVNNAGVMALPEQRTPAGSEMQLATNHLGHFALALGLRAALAADGAARIVSGQFERPPALAHGV